MRYLIIILIFNFSIAYAQEISEDAKRSFYRGQAAMEIAKTNEDYALAIKEFNEAAKLAPKWSDVYYVLGEVHEKMALYSEAINNYKKYIELAPNAANAASVKANIYKLEYKAEIEKKKLAVIDGWASGTLNRKDSYNSFAKHVFIQVNGVMMMDLVYGETWRCQKVTTTFDEKTIKMNYTYYDFDGSVTDPEVQKWFTKKITFTGTVVSINPLVLEVLEVVKSNDGDTEEVKSTWIFNK